MHNRGDVVGAGAGEVECEAGGARKRGGGRATAHAALRLAQPGPALCFLLLVNSKHLEQEKTDCGITMRHQQAPCDTAQHIFWQRLGKSNQFSSSGRSTANGAHIMQSSAAVPAPSECPTRCSRQSGFASRNFSSVGFACRCIQRAAASMPK